MSHTILRLPEVIKRTGYSRSTIYLKTSKGIFPKPIGLGDRAVGWLEAEIETWINGRIQQSRITVNTDHCADVQRV